MKLGQIELFDHDVLVALQASRLGISESIGFALPEGSFNQFWSAKDP